MLKFENVSLKYPNNIQALNQVNFEIKPGEFVFLVGQSGSGKSSILKVLLKELNVTDGIVTVNKKELNRLKRKEIPYFRRELGIIFQDFRLLKDQTVFQNVAYAMKVVGANHDEIKREVMKVLEQVGLHEKAKLYPNELSGGEQQRVAIARALVNKPSILICDEPTGNLDPINAKEVMNLLNDINEQGTTIIMATHDSNLVNENKKRVITLEKGQIISDDHKGGYSLEN